MTDCGGIPLTVLISAANTNDHLLLERLVDSVAPVRRPLGRPRTRPDKVHGDKGYDYRVCRTALRRRGITARIARTGIESATRLGRHRYVVERALEWITRFRRLVRRYERIGAHIEAFARPACALICYRRTIRTGVLLNNPN